MQRPASSSRVSKDQHVAIDMSLHHYPTSRKWTEGAGDIPSFSGIDHNKNSRSKSSGWKWIHVIPAIVVFCFFILWYLSYPVDLEIKDGRITAIHPRKMPKSVNDTHVDITILAKSTPPVVSVSEISPSNFSVSDISPPIVSVSEISPSSISVSEISPQNISVSEILIANTTVSPQLASGTD